jgi:hypothetical protein
MNKKSAAADVDPSFAPVAAAFAKNPNVCRGKMFSSKSVLNVGGKILVMLVRGRLVAKLPKTRVDELVKSGNGQRFDPGHGKLMKEWIEIVPETVDWVELAKEAYRFVNRL